MFTGSKHGLWLHRDTIGSAQGSQWGFLVFAECDTRFEGHTAHDSPVATQDVAAQDAAGPRRGRPPKMSGQEVLDRIRRMASSHGGLFRVHHRNARLYARARRNFGSWSAAVQAAGLDYGEAMTGARQRAARNRRRSRLPDRSPAAP